MFSMSFTSKILFGIAFLVAEACGAQAPTPLTFQVDGTVSDAVAIIETTMAGNGAASLGCKLPVVYKSSDDQLKRKNGQQVSDDQMRQSLLQQLQLDEYKDAKGTYFDAYVTRLFDTPSVDWVFGVLTDQELLGVVQPSTDPNALLIWKTGTSLVKYDCSSVFKIATKANANYSFLDIASLQASFDGSQTNSSTKGVVIVTGQAQSLFDQYYGTGNSIQKLFAAMKGIEWYEKPLVKNAPADKKRLQHLTSAHIISFASTQNVNSAQSIAASLSASLGTIPIVSGSGSTSVELNNSFQQISSNFKTFYFNANASTLPTLAEMVTTAHTFAALTNTVTPSNAVAFPKDVVQLKGDIDGWPTTMCVDQLWVGSVQDTTNFTFNSIQMTPGTPTVDGFPVCTVTLSAKVTDAAATGTWDPKFLIAYKADDAVAIDLPVPLSLFVKIVTTPTFNKSGVFPVAVAAQTNMPVAGPVRLIWGLNGSIVNNGQTIQSYAIDPSTPCTLQDPGATPIQLDSIFATAYGSQPTNSVLFGTSTASSLLINNPSPYQTIWLGYDADSSMFDTLAPLSAWQARGCVVNGKINMTIGGNIVPSSFAVSIPFPPKRSSPSVVTVDCGQPASTPATVSLTGSGSGLTCTLFGTNLDLISQVTLSGVGLNLVAPLAMYENSAQARFTISPSNVSTLKPGTYNLTLTLSSGGPSIGASSKFIVGP